jgi:glyoxylase-like metal-dependent hydrolase (beta-lactamase superfamily II)
MNTHLHADHITGTGQLKLKTSSNVKSVISELSGAISDIHLVEFDSVEFGSWQLCAISTPGHTEGCMSFMLDDFSRVFTGDTLLIRGCGRTDFQVTNISEWEAEIDGAHLQSEKDLIFELRLWLNVITPNCFECFES